MSACDLLFKQLDSKVGELSMVTDTLTNKFNSLTGGINDIASVDTVTLAEDAASLNTSITEASTAMNSDISTAASEGCGALDGCIDGISASIAGLANIEIPFLSGVVLPGGGLVAQLSDMAGKVEGFASGITALGISSILGFADDYISCLAESEPTRISDIQQRMDTINNSLTSVGLTVEGTADTDTLMAGVDSSIKDSISSVTETLSTAKESAAATALSVLPPSETKLPSSFI